ncbi:Clock-controlled protein 6 [Fusarium euwallaceae]|uniref:Clock-controlled protein 6 n=3 Tax=Fusarium solani species complex TaxID=232080 RepID=A0A428TAQ7_9HYPO|nr:Clock-controlled protein 6 [Fusarium sp. AF-6]RSL99115.1 Clock-controlled protein 6 [Fusarium oligoseptatum]RSM17383.1 Clock-controlled protein 6 [Fusarium ambrosium]RTE76701.1 Clock-controlled protein 6 [Fusarium euwallaceae]
MKFAAALAFAAGVAAHAKSNVTYTTEVVTAYTTYCPGPTEITHGGKTYTITEATTLTITDCPCTVTKPVITTSAVVCHDCPAPPPAKGHNSTFVPVQPTGSKPGYSAPGNPSGPVATPTSGAPEEVPTAGAGKVAALSGAGLAAVVGLAAFL